MAWTDRLKEGAYISPSGVRTVFDFEDVRQIVEKRTSAFNFPDVDGTFVQDLGRSGRRFPLRMFFSGGDHDLDAAAFLDALSEKGRGKLEHPFYGTFDAVPFGQIIRRDDLKTAANQTIFDVTFYETTGVPYPNSQDDPGSGVAASVSEFQASISEEFDLVTDLDQAVEKATLQSQFSALLGSTASVLGPIADTVDSVRSRFNAIRDSIDRGIDILISDPLTLAFQTTQLILAPAKAVAGISARLSAYGDLAQSLISGDGAVVSPGLDSRNSNEFHARDVFASSYVAASVSSIVNNTFTTKPEAIDAADTVLTLFEDVSEWRDNNFESLEEIDQGAAYQKLQEAVAVAAGFLVQISFSLKQERRIVLDRARTVIDLVSELYGDVDDSIDYFITSNDLTGSEILELPEGKEIVYFI